MTITIMPVAATTSADGSNRGAVGGGACRRKRRCPMEKKMDKGG